MPPPPFGGIGILPVKGGQVNRSATRRNILLVQQSNALEMLAQRRLNGNRKNCNAIFFTLAIPDADLVHLETQIMNTESKTLHEPQAAPVEGSHPITSTQSMPSANAGRPKPLSCSSNALSAVTQSGDRTPAVTEAARNVKIMKPPCGSIANRSSFYLLTTSLRPLRFPMSSDSLPGITRASFTTFSLLVLPAHSKTLA